MPMIERRQLRLVQSLDYGQDRSVDEADICIRALVTYIPNPAVVLREEILDEISAADYVLQ